MKGRRLDRPYAGCMHAGRVYIGRSTAAQNPQTAKLPEKKKPSDGGQRAEFLEEVENRYFDLTNKAQRASWVEETLLPMIRNRSQQTPTRSWTLSARRCPRRRTNLTRLRSTGDGAKNVAAEAGFGIHRAG